MSTRDHDGLDDETVGRILAWLERANVDRQEMVTNIGGMQTSLQNIQLTLGKQESLLDTINKRTAILDGDEGLANRMFLAEAQIKSHDLFIQNVRSFVIKIIAAALTSGSLTGLAASHFYHVFVASAGTN